jgi:homoserine O-acetyltransferase
MMRSFILSAFFLLTGAAAAGPLDSAKEGDFVARDFAFRSGETMAELRLHYTTLGQPKRDTQGRVTNAIMILHGTGGDGHQFFRKQFADVLFEKGGLLDPARFYIILPDGIGHGKSSKPSDGLRMAFPRYDYDDMVAAQHLLLTKGLGVDRLRLIMGTSMGCMHAFVWGETYPDFMDAMMPLACLPVEIGGRNRMWRKMSMDAIMLDPDWQGGAYVEQPVRGLRTAVSLLIIAGSAPILWQKNYPTREAADEYIQKTVAERMAGLDANDLLYQLGASRSYNPARKLETIRAHVLWINSADDFINPPELRVAERMVRRLDRGTFVLLPASEETRGHSTHTWPKLWHDYLAALLAVTE